MSVSEITETRQYLTFKLGNEIFATDVAKVREVLDFTTITEIPRTPDFMSGVINLRGSVVPVVDLRLCFEMSKTVRTRNTCIVVVEVLLENESTVIGALADSVEEVIDLEPDQIQPAPRIGTQIRTDFIKGMGRRDTQFIMILDIDRVFSAEELAAIRVPETNKQLVEAAVLRGGRRWSRSMRADSHAMSSHDEGISNSDFARLCSLIYAQSGITLSPDKKTMLELRIKRRLRSLELDSYSQYCDYLFGHQGQRDEIVHLLDVVTTNKTDFYREPAHFDYLVQKALPDLMARNPSGRDLLIWSAGCSTGEEPYTLAIVLTEYALTHPGFRFRVLATDLSTTVLEKAHLGVFSSEVVRPVPADLRKKYFLRGRDPESNRVRVVPGIAQARGVSALEFHGRRFWTGRKSGRDLLPKRNHLL